jgi:Calpain family cysteine protease
MISPTAEDSIENQRIKNIFLQSTYPAEGIFALNMYVRGRPYTITIDDYLPTYNGGLIFEDNSSGDKNVWAALLEKAFAKVVGNYEYVNDGWQVESMRFFTGAPSAQVSISGSGATYAASVFNTIKSALSSGFNCGCDTDGYANYNLVTSHAYHIIGAYQLTGSNGAVAHNLLHVRNPWGLDYGFSGAWSDGGSAWTAAFEA